MVNHHAEKRFQDEEEAKIVWQHVQKTHDTAVIVKKNYFTGASEELVDTQGENSSVVRETPNEQDISILIRKVSVQSDAILDILTIQTSDPIFLYSPVSKIYPRSPH